MIHTRLVRTDGQDGVFGRATACHPGFQAIQRNCRRVTPLTGPSIIEYDCRSFAFGRKAWAVPSNKSSKKDHSLSFDGQTPHLQEVLDVAWSLIGAGVSDRRSSFHLPTVASISSDGLPTMRTVVLRGVDVTNRVLRFHTDCRSTKFSELSVDSRIALHFYDASIKTQIRLEATGELHVEDPLAVTAWKASRPISRLCYAADIGSGVEVPSPPAAPTPNDVERDSGFGNFCLVLATVHHLEWLHLAVAGHKRASFEWVGDGSVSARWLAP